MKIIALHYYKATTGATGDDKKPFRLDSQMLNTSFTIRNEIQSGYLATPKADESNIILYSLSIWEY